MNDYVYFLGGLDGANRLPTVEVARADATGSVGAWHYAAPLKEGRSATAVAVHGDTENELGGMGGAGALNRAEMARQFDNGRLGRPLSRKRNQKSAQSMRGPVSSSQRVI